VKSRNAKEGIGNVERDRRIWITGSRNLEADRKSLKSIEAPRGRSSTCAGRSKDVECRRRQRRGRRDADHLIPQFMTVIQKYYLDSISRTDDAVIGRN
jgi:hypothetical protein